MNTTTPYNPDDWAHIIIRLTGNPKPLMMRLSQAYFLTFLQDPLFLREEPSKIQAIQNIWARALLDSKTIHQYYFPHYMKTVGFYPFRGRLIVVDFQTKTIFKSFDPFDASNRPDRHEAEATLFKYEPLLVRFAREKIQSIARLVQAGFVFSKRDLINWDFSRNEIIELFCACCPNLTFLS